MSAYADLEMRRYLESHLSQDHGYSHATLVEQSLAWLVAKHMEVHDL